MKRGPKEPLNLQIKDLSVETKLFKTNARYFLFLAELNNNEQRQLVKLPTTRWTTKFRFPLMEIIFSSPLEPNRLWGPASSLSRRRPDSQYVVIVLIRSRYTPWQQPTRAQITFLTSSFQLTIQNHPATVRCISRSSLRKGKFVPVLN
jgi:hypothetical protein